MVTGNISDLYLAMDWIKILVQHLSGNIDRRSCLAEHLGWMCFTLHYGPADKRSAVWSIGACFFAMRQLGCSPAIISWMQHYAQVAVTLLPIGGPICFCEGLF